MKVDDNICCMVNVEEKLDWCRVARYEVQVLSDGKPYCIFHAPHDEKEKFSNSMEEAVLEKLSKIKNSVYSDFRRTVFHDIDFNVIASELEKKYSQEFNINHLNWTNCIFNGDVSFAEQSLSEIKNFENLKFHGNVDFTKSAVSYHVLRGLKFVGGENKVVRFHETSLRSDHYEEIFKDIIFDMKVEFHKTKFSVRMPLFVDTIFKHNVSFCDLDIENQEVKQLKFANKNFTDTVDLKNINFGTEVLFEDISFQDLNLNGSKFAGVAKFIDCSFKEKADFSGGTFNDYVEFKSNLDGSFREGADFTKIIIEKELRFENIDVSKMQFLDTDVRKVEFINCFFAKGKDLKECFREDVFTMRFFMKVISKLIRPLKLSQLN